MTATRRPKHKLRVARPRRGAVTLWVGTRKGAFRLKSDAERKAFTLREPWFLGCTVHHVVADPRDASTVLAAVRSPRDGATVYASQDRGKTFEPARVPPAFGPPAEGLAARTVNHVFWLSPGHASEPFTWYAGTSPHGLFKSEDRGETWRPVEGLNAHPSFDRWTGIERDATPDGPTLHSILVDPRDAEHLYVALSPGGCLESRDGGREWTPLPPEPAPRGSREGAEGRPPDPHALAFAPSNPDRLWQQGRSGVYRMDRDEGGWEHVGRHAPRACGDRGFPILVSPFDPDTAWVFPMDAEESWSRTAPGGRPAVLRTSDAGATWERLDRGLPSEHAWWTVKRQCMAHDLHDPLGIYLATSSGEVWGSINAGRSWRCLARHLPHVYSIEAG